MFLPVAPRLDNVIDIDTRKPVWLVVREKCQACNFAALGVVHKRSDMDAQECGKCHRHRSVVTHFLKDQGADGLSEHARIIDAATEPEWIARVKSKP